MMHDISGAKGIYCGYSKHCLSSHRFEAFQSGVAYSEVNAPALACMTNVVYVLFLVLF